MEAVDISNSTLASLAQGLRIRKYRASDVTRAVLEQLHKTEASVHAYAYLDEEGALARAEAIDREIRDQGPHSVLHGIPIGIKDLFETKDMPTQAGSGVLCDYRPTQDAEIVRVLRSNGAIFLGKQRTHEFGLGMDEPASRSPWASGRYPGGSSVGGAVSTVVGSCVASFGTDGGGSVRKPASINGLVGLKPTLGRIDARGIVPGPISVDHIGWMTLDVEDSALICSLLTGEQADLAVNASTLRLGCLSYFFRDIEPDIEQRVRDCLEALVDRGATVTWLNVPELEDAAQVHQIIASAETYRLHAAFIERKAHLYHPKTLDALRAAAAITDVQLVAARRAREQLTAAIQAAFKRHGLHALCSPTVGLSPVLLDDMDPPALLGRYTRLTSPFNLTGHPAASVPCGIDRNGVPIGFQIAGPLEGESQVLRVARVVEACSSAEVAALRLRFRS